DGVGWGGRFDDVAEGLRQGAFEEEHVRFFAGYAGWGAGQLVEEVDEGSWLVLPGEAAWVFTTEPESLWRDILQGLGGEWALWANMPDDPRMN
ncbi:MAG: YqgE/AlgH family protein, partial [Rhodothermales bacterium]|nr:YqgE/AlgH family protein [Rhodothermales bacterium]